MKAFKTTFSIFSLILLLLLQKYATRKWCVLLRCNYHGDTLETSIHYKNDLMVGRNRPWLNQYQLKLSRHLYLSFEHFIFIMPGKIYFTKCKCFREINSREITFKISAASSETIGDDCRSDSKLTLPEKSFNCRDLGL